MVADAYLDVLVDVMDAGNHANQDVKVLVVVTAMETVDHHAALDVKALVILAA